MSPWVWMLIAACMAVSYFAAQYLSALPVAPECPSCRAVTGSRARSTVADRLMARLGGASARECPRCGWAGRMRWRLAAARASRK